MGRKVVKGSKKKKVEKQKNPDIWIKKNGQVLVLNPAKKIERINPEPEKPSIKGFYTKLTERLNTPALTDQIKQEMADIVTEAGIKNADKDSEFIKETYNNIIEDIKSTV